MSDLLEEFADGILTLTINRPDAHNTMNTALTDLLLEAVQRGAEDPAVRCVILTGAGRVFSAGGDVGDQASGANFDAGLSQQEADAAFEATIRRGSDIATILHEMPKPSLAVMNGAAAGAGLALALACDFRFCLDTAKLTTAYAKIGLSGDSGISYFLPRLVGQSKAKELLFSADRIAGTEALAMGLVTRVATAETFAEEARAFAEHLASLPTVAVGFMKENLAAAEHRSLGELLDLESRNVVRAMRTEDHQRAAAAFVRKEPPTFEGR